MSELTPEETSKLLFGSQNAVPIWHWVGSRELEEEFTGSDIYQAFHAYYAFSIINQQTKKLIKLSLIEKLPTQPGILFRPYVRTTSQLWAPMNEICSLIVTEKYSTPES